LFMKVVLINSLIVLTVVSLLPALGGCGSGNSTDSPLTKKQFITRGEKICRQARREQFELQAQVLKKFPGTEEGYLVRPALIPALEREISRLKALNPPVADKKEVQAMIKEIELGVDDADSDPFDVLVEWSDPFKKANQLARRYGFKICAENPPRSATN
jgi:hypothetical protein